MVNMANMAELMIEGLADAGGGGVQRWAWEQSENIGMLTTGGFIVAGLVLPMFMRNQITDVVSKGMFHSGAAIAGWITTEKVFKMNDRPRALAQGDYREPRRLNAGHFVPGLDGQRAPEVAISGINPNTGERILDSRN